ncbi:MAG: TetR/AcrR family transcriptional regulator [Clostridiales bacterium]|nr:TetR/AcrR family transcriptional regulator [Clostridiales bacterium]
MATKETAQQEAPVSELEKRSIQRLSGEESNRISRECLRTALMQLLSERDFQKISVTELVRRAGVSRATFYRNYSDKEALLREIGEAAALEIQSFLRATRTPEDVYQSALGLFRNIKEHERVTRNMVSFHISLSAVMAMPPLAELEEPPTDATTHYWHLAFEGAVLNIVRDWMVNGMQQSPEEMAQVCASLASEVRNWLAG